jgi:ATP-dependent Clp protease ATP-binding subunit ClpA
MFERFTERARQVVVLAQEEARTLKHNYIGTEHILLGLLREEEGLAARVLESLDITVERVRGQVVRIVGSGEEVTSGQIPFTPRAKKVLELALREALSLGHNYIGTEHILLGLVRENEGVAARILLDFDADSEKIRNEVIRMLSGPSGRAACGPAGESAWDETWQPSLRWDEARVVWEPDGELEVPLRLERRAVALLDESEVWRAEPLAAVGHEIRGGVLRITGASLLETIDPNELRRVLDDAVRQAHDAAAQSRSREAVLAQAFLARLRESPEQPRQPEQPGAPEQPEA